MSSPARPLQNIYYERKVATERPCYICKRPTATVLATIDTKDFVYTCLPHLLVPQHQLTTSATLLTPPAAPTSPGPSQEDIRKVIAEHKAREAKKADKEKEKKEESMDGREPPLTTSASGSPKPSSTPTPTSPPPVPTPGPSHRKFALHRQIFDMRVQEIKRKEQGVKAREVGKGLPQVPRGVF